MSVRETRIETSWRVGCVFKITVYDSYRELGLPTGELLTDLPPLGKLIL